VGYYPVTTVTIFRYVAKREATRRNVTEEYSVEISGVNDLSFLFAMRFGAEGYNPPFPSGLEPNVPVCRVQADVVLSESFSLRSFCRETAEDPTLLCTPTQDPRHQARVTSAS
jgi:hypothetical protein